MMDVWCYERNAVLAKNVPDGHGAALVAEPGFCEAEFCDAFLHIFGIRAGAEHTGNVAFDVGHEHGNAHIAERLRHHFQGDGLACAGSSGDEAVAVCHFRQNKNVLAVIVLRDPNFSVL